MPQVSIIKTFPSQLYPKGNYPLRGINIANAGYGAWWPLSPEHLEE